MSERDRLDAEQLAAYFTVMEVGSLLRHAVEKHLRREGGLSYVQFEILAMLSHAPSGQQRMTDIADRVVYSRSGLTYQAEQLERAGLISRAPAPDDDRSTTVTVTAKGRALIERILPGHVRLVRELFLDTLSRRDITALTKILGQARDRMRTAPPRSAAPRARRST